MSAPATFLALLRRPGVLATVVVALLAEVAFAVLNLSTMPLFLLRELRLPESQIGLVMSAFLISEAALKRLTGAFGDRRGHARAVLYGALIAAVSAFVTVQARALLPLFGWGGGMLALQIGLRALDGWAAALIWPNLFALNARAAGEADAPTSLGLINACYLIGIAIAFPLGGVLNDSAGTPAASVRFAAGLFLVVAIGATSLFAVRAVDSPRSTAGEARTAAVPSGKVPARLLAIGALVFGGIGFPTFIVKLLPMTQFQMSEAAFGAIILPAALTMAALAGPLAAWGQRLGQVRAIRTGLGLGLLGAMLPGCASVMPALRTPTLLAISSVPIGIGFLLAIPAWYSYVSATADRAGTGRAIGAVMMAQGIGAILTAPVGSAWFGLNAYGPFVGTAACLSLAAGLAWGLPAPESGTLQSEAGSAAR
ncbi:MAG: MFS transporter [Fimbriimonadaceae bacterium]|nr:MFS transporter [Fimbriimonadaceae bacterium]